MRILFIDDDRRRMQPYVSELEDNGHKVVFRTNVDSALETIHDPAERFDLIVLDISMPAGTAYKFEDTVGGTRTGLQLYDTIRRARPDLKIVALTNVSDPRLAEYFGGEDARLCRLVRKPEQMPSEFVNQVEEFISAADNQDVP